MRISIAFLLAVTCLPVLGQQGEVIARQASPAETVSDFESPMVLEIPLPPRRLLDPSRAVDLTDKVRKFRCEGTSFASLLIRRWPDKGKRDKAEARLELSGYVYVHPSYDRYVDLRFSLVKGDTEIATVEDRGIDAEEDKERPFEARLSIPLAAFEELFEGEEKPRLDVMMTVVDND